MPGLCPEWSSTLRKGLPPSFNTIQKCSIDPPKVYLLVDLRYDQVDYFAILFSIPVINIDQNQPGQEMVYWAYRFQQLMDEIQSRN